MRYLFFVLMYVGAFNAAASETQPLIAHVIKGALMVVPENNQERVQNAKALLQKNNGASVEATAWIQVWAFSCSSAHWARDGNVELDDGKRGRRFATHLPFSILQHLKEDNLLVLKWGDKELHLICAQYGMRFGDVRFEQQIAALLNP